MESRRKDTAWTLILILLLVITLAGGYSFYQKRAGSGQLLVIHQPQPEPITASNISQIYIGGAVKKPGFYPTIAKDTLQDIIRDAGGFTADADLNNININIATSSEKPQPQKININTAESWLLQALPQIGKTIAQEIIDYRTKNGPFKNIQELIKVKGIGPKKFDQIKDLITVQ